MDDEIPPDAPAVTPDNGGDKQPPNNKTSEECSDQSEDHVRRRKARIIALRVGACIAIGAEVYLLLWIWSDFIGCHEVPRLYLLSATLVVGQSVFGLTLYKSLKNSFRVTLSVWILLTILTEWVTYKNINSITSQASPIPTLQDEINYYSRTAQAREWKPPEMKGLSVVSIGMGGSGYNSYVIPNGIIDSGSEYDFLPLIAGPGGAPVGVYLKDKRLYVRAQTPFGDEATTVHMNNEWPVKIPDGWDKNFNENAFEIVDRTMLPVLQVRYMSPFSVDVQGVFVGQNGDVTVIFGDNINFASAGDRLPAIPSRKAWFKYPSKYHLGELAQ